MKISVARDQITEFLTIFLNEKYSKSFKKEIKKSSEPVIVDIGAGEGYFSLYILSMFPRARVFSFELASDHFKTLHTYWTEYNHSSFSIYNYRICKNDGLFLESQGYNKTLFVKSFRINTLRKKHHLKHIDVLKLSCAGNEYEILYSLPAQEFSTIDRIVMDVHDMDKGAKNMDNMVAFLSLNGYRVLIEREPGSNYKSMIWATRMNGTNTKTISTKRNADRYL